MEAGSRRRSLLVEFKSDGRTKSDAKMDRTFQVIRNAVLSIIQDFRQMDFSEIVNVSRQGHTET
jgi:hypothetical protein